MKMCPKCGKRQFAYTQGMGWICLSCHYFEEHKGIPMFVINGVRVMFWYIIAVIGLAVFIISLSAS